MIFILVASIILEIHASILFFEPFDDESLGMKWIQSISKLYYGTFDILERANDLLETRINTITTQKDSANYKISAKLDIESFQDDFVLQYILQAQ
ncbi:MAG: hypothetical protein EZS28_034173 [Streblomastix strix]|uniref:Uncharacterized protein n=1 Tax=Streblomastix strix TaxID=222440 RepID=A0A5J4UJT8_9EUKA|nr:MAG: hypothetical protein EZS28_034173 [Streblomastix strix]